MRLSQGLLASTLLTAIKAQDDNNDNPDSPVQYATAFAESLIAKEQTTLDPNYATAFPATLLPHDETYYSGDDDETFPLSLIPHSQTYLDGQSDNENTFPATLLPSGQTALDGQGDNENTFPPTQLPPGQTAQNGDDTPPAASGQVSPGLPTITIPPSSNDPYSRIIRPYTGTGTFENVVTTVAQPSGTQAGTIIVDVASSVYSSFQVGQPGALTIPPSSDDPRVTVIQASPGPSSPPKTITIPASGTA
ncbi:hypothetical protein FDECE_17579, partial [Fusarium decemcellulare]